MSSTTAKKYPWVIRPTTSTSSVPPIAVLDGLHGLGFPVRTLQVGTRRPSAQVVYPRPVEAGSVLLYLRRRTGDLSADRYITLGADQVLTLDVAPWDDVGLFIQSATLPGYNVGAIAYEDDGPRAADDEALLVSHYAASGTYAVPPGARSVAVATTDPAWRWLTWDIASAADVQLPAPAGWLSSQVWGDRFTIGLAPQGVVWRIAL